MQQQLGCPHPSLPPFLSLTHTLACLLACLGCARYTPETRHSLEAVWAVLGNVLEQAEESLQGQILAQRDEHVTAEQYKEIKEVFEFFDQDQDSVLKPDEFHNCCTGIGVIMTSEEVRVACEPLGVIPPTQLLFCSVLFFFWPSVPDACFVPGAPSLSQPWPQLTRTVTVSSTLTSSRRSWSSGLWSPDTLRKMCTPPSLTSLITKRLCLRPH